MCVHVSVCVVVCVSLCVCVCECVCVCVCVCVLYERRLYESPLLFSHPSSLTRVLAFHLPGMLSHIISYFPPFVPCPLFGVCVLCIFIFFSPFVFISILISVCLRLIFPLSLSL